MIKRLMLLLLLLIVLFGVAPVVSVAIAVAIANFEGCRLDEGSIHSCVVFGQDIGETLYTMFVAGWFGLWTLPLAAIALVAWAAAALILLVVFRRRRAG